MSRMDKFTQKKTIGGAISGPLSICLTLATLGLFVSTHGLADTTSSSQSRHIEAQTQMVTPAGLRHEGDVVLRWGALVARADALVVSEDVLHAENVRMSIRWGETSLFAMAQQARIEGPILFLDSDVIISTNDAQINAASAEVDLNRQVVSMKSPEGRVAAGRAAISQQERK